MNLWRRITSASQSHGLMISGAFHTAPDDAPALPPTGTVVMLSPDEGAFWSDIQSQPEFTDGAPDPMDRWSARVIGAMADDLGARAAFPFSGPPYLPFFTWATRTGRAWVSPAVFLVHDRLGLYASYRGALVFDALLDIPAPEMATAPCDTCAAPCLSACPVNAVAGGTYDVDACHNHLATSAGQACLKGGCLVRQSCPVGENCGRVRSQSAFHMAAFHP